MPLLRRHPAARTVDVAWVTTYLREPPGFACHQVGRVPLDLERAHACLDKPHVAVRAIATETFLSGQPMRECAWVIEVVAFVEAEALDLAAAALEGLRGEIAAGRIQVGAHAAAWERDPFGRREQELALFWREQLVRLERR